MTEEAERDAEPEILGDGDVYIDDMPDFLERFGAIAIQNKDGQLFVLLRDTLQWKNVERAVKRGPRPVE